MDDNHGDLEIDENRLKAADPDGLYLFMLKDYPYMMTLVPKLGLLNYLYKDRQLEEGDSYATSIEMR